MKNKIKMNGRHRAYLIVGCMMIFGLLFLSSCQTTYQVTFQDETGEIYTIVKVKKNKTVSPIDQPTQPGYTFLHWEKEGTKFDFDTPIQQDIVLVAKFESNQRTVIFYEDEDAIYQTMIVNTGDLLQIEPPKREGYVFKGWMKDQQLVQLDTYRVKENSVFYALWEKQIYTITFDTDGGLPLDTQEVGYEEIMTPVVPTKDGYSFVGWYVSGKPFSPETKITQNLHLVAKWTRVYTVTVHPNNGEDNIQILVPEGKTILAVYPLEDPVKENHQFMYYCVDESCTTVFMMSRIITMDMDLYARFDPIYTISYELNGGIATDLLTSYLPNQIQYEPIPLAIPTKEGYYFRGWYEEADYSGARYNILQMGEHRNITLYAKWEEKSLKNAYMGFLGDSISTFKGYIPAGYSYFYPQYCDLLVEQTWWKMTVDRIGCKLGINNSYSGTCVSQKYGASTAGESVSRLLKSKRFDNLPPDILIIFMGMNDSLAAPYGLNEAEFEKAYRNMLNNIYQLYPEVQLFLCTLTYETNYQSKEESIYLQHIANSQALNQVIQKLAQEYQLPLIDFANAFHSKEYLVDTVHPNIKGMTAMADLAVEAVQKFYNEEPQQVQDLDVELVTTTVNTNVALEELRKKLYIEGHDI
ncbi:MAG: InlB B-repeat-containing protein [Prevotella sp.]|nr:InlB B-repeat-containing protein [Staphylococcus sp.]MCM1350794.1 InlB B-repeat-containing protein [Prevotella sp.]